MAENYQKIFNKINQNNPNLNFLKPSNIEYQNTLRKNDLVKILSKVNGTEKLIQTIKGGFNESLREMLLEISAMKNFILEINSEIVKYGEKLELKDLVKLDNRFMNMPFMDSVIQIKYAFRTNIKKSFDFWNPEDKGNEKDIKGDIISGRSFLNKGKENVNLKEEKNIIKGESISLIREKCDSIFESDNKVQYSNEKFCEKEDLFDKMEYDLDKFDIDLDESKREKNEENSFVNKTNKIEIDFFDKESCKAFFPKEDDRFETSIFSKNENKGGDAFFEEKEDLLADKELEFLKRKWMKNISD